jgi:23S rRNA-/tRNA-specific pseudouridylate synthase/ubiquinone/menaquinone biosynthesis C-methylase UbiE
MRPRPPRPPASSGPPGPQRPAYRTQRSDHPPRPSLPRPPQLREAEPPLTTSGAIRRLRRGVAILFEDDDLLVIDKPTGIVTADPASSGDGGRRSAKAGNTVFDILKDYVRSQPGASRGKRSREPGPHGRDQGVWIIHRLDKEASGVLVFAKSLRAFNWLKEDLRAKRMDREYIAVTEGLVGQPEETGSIQTFMKDDGPVRLKPPARGGPSDRRPANFDPEEGRLAVTHYKVIGASSGPTPRTLLRVRLDTGRKNQIRIHFADRAQPLVGDRKFGAKTDPLDRLALHATELGFTHPATGRPLQFVSPAPAGFYRLVGLDSPAPPAEPAPPAPPLPPPPPAESRERKPGPAPVASPVPTTAPAEVAAAPRGPSTSWDAVAHWYDDLLEDRGNDHYDQVILPGTLRLLKPSAGLKVLDLACGQGILGRRLASQGVESVGVEASPRLVQAAEKRARDEGLERLCRFTVGDARELGQLEPGAFDAAACIMALSNIDPLLPVMQGVARALKPGGHFVWVITHPAFRAAGQSDWGWDAKTQRQYRRTDGYLSAAQKSIEMNPGRAARGESTAKTWTFHRPLQTYFESMAGAGLLVERLEEWPSLRASTSGPRAAEENRARREIPLFLGVRAVRPHG